MTVNPRVVVTTLWIAAALAWVPQARSSGLALELEPILGGLDRPVAIAHAGDGSGRLFIVEQSGEVLLFDGSALLPYPFLDISAQVVCCGERGLLGLAFHPDFANNGFFYVYYTTAPTNPPDVVDSVLARYSVSAGNPNQADPTSALVLLRVGQPFPNHNGGQLAFGPDGFLYIALGDGGSGGDPENNGQSLNSLLGAILRIDVDNPDPGRNYGIPTDNPFTQDFPAGCADSCIGAPCGITCDEIWAYGLRNPWRFSFDRQTGDLFIGDVGQAVIEEIDFQPAASTGGQNYGWNLMEGTTCFSPPTGCNDGSLILPILEYSHAEGCAMIGGYRYRGTLERGLDGVYLFGDFCSGTLWGTVPRCDGAWERRVLLESGLSVLTFGEDEQGEVYLAELDDPDQSDLFRLRLTAASDGPLLGPNPAALDFGVHQPNELATLNLTVTNSNAGPEALLVSGLSSTDPARFVLDLGAGTNPCGSPSFCLPPGASCTMAVAFSSTSQGIFNESLLFDVNSPVNEVPLQAVARVPCSLAPTLTVSNEPPIDTARSFEACKTIDVGPQVHIVSSGAATFLAGERVSFGDDFSVIGGQLTVVIDPLLAID